MAHDIDHRINIIASKTMHRSIQRFMEGWTTEYKEELAMEMAVKSAEKAARSAALASFLHGFFGALPHGDVIHGEASEPSRDGFRIDGGYGTFHGYFRILLGFSRDGA